MTRSQARLILLSAFVLLVVVSGCARAIEPDSSHSEPHEAAVTAERPAAHDLHSLMKALGYCGHQYERAIAHEKRAGVLLHAAHQRAVCTRQATDEVLAKVAYLTRTNGRVRADEALDAVERYRATQLHLCGYYSLAAGPPGSQAAQLEEARCSFQTERNAALIVAAWGFLDREVAIPVPAAFDEFPWCYEEYDSLVERAEDSFDLQGAQLTLWACVADAAEARRNDLVNAAVRNVDSFDRQYLADDIALVLEESSENQEELCSLFVAVGKEPRTTVAAFNRATCNTDAEVLRDDLARTRVIVAPGR